MNGAAKGGYYPCPPDAITMATKQMRAPSTPFSLLDPAAGRGQALLQLATELGCDQSGMYAIELEDERANAIHAEYISKGLDKAHVLAPASFFGCKASSSSFSMIWLNPPFDNLAEGGGRVETKFLAKATHWLMDKGILALVCPEHVSDDYDMRNYLTQWYTRIRITPFPASCRQYGEVIVTAVKRSSPVESWTVPWQSNLADPGYVYDIPPGLGPKRFEKVELTDTEVGVALERSPLRKLFAEPKEQPLPSPPLALGTGHIALLLASGHLDGVVKPVGEQHHVVRGTARKSQYVSAVETSENEKDGSVTTKTTISEKVNLIIRTVTADGELRTLMEE